MPFTITSDLGVVLLAAGRQERFGGSGKPKCLTKIGEITIYQRLRDSFCSGWNVVTVINSQWDLDHRREVEVAVVVPHGRLIGSSIAAGLKALRDIRGDDNGHALIVAADTWIPWDKFFQVPPWIGAIVDPWSFVTIFRVGASEEMAAYFEKQAVGRAEYLARPGVRAWVRDTGYFNINTPEDLERAKKGETLEWCGL